MQNEEMAVEFDDSVETEEVEAQEVEQEQPEESQEEQAAREEADKVSFDERQQRFIEEKILGPKVARFRNIERENEELQRKIQEIEGQLGHGGPPPVPEMPDPWDDNFEQKIKERDQALLARAEYERNTQMQQENQQREFVQSFNATVASYNENAKKLGVSASDLKLAGQAVAAHRLPDDLVVHLLAHEAGPAITVYLSENISELDDISRMSPLAAATYIERNIVPKTGRKRRSAPPPASGPRGAAVGRSSDPLLKGASFE